MICVLTLTAFARAQVRQSGPVDQAVGDLDSLSTSLRRVEPGLGQFNARAALRELPAAPWTVGVLPAPNGQRYVYEAPGFRAYMDRPDYLVVGSSDAGPPVRRNVSPGVDGGFLPMAPANLVYDLRPPSVRTLPPPELDPHWTDTRLDTRIGPLPTVRLDASFNHGATGNLDLTPDRHIGTEPRRNRQVSASPAQQQVVDETD